MGPASGNPLLTRGQRAQRVGEASAFVIALSAVLLLATGIRTLWILAPLGVLLGLSAMWIASAPPGP